MSSVPFLPWIDSWRISANAEPSIGHFGSFRSRFEQKLWKVRSGWLKVGFPQAIPGELIFTMQRWDGHASDGGWMQPESQEKSLLTN